MNRLLCVAWREFSATVFTRGFLLGVLMTPVFIAIVAGAVVLMQMQPPPKVVGSLAVIDRGGAVTDRLAERLTPAALEGDLTESGARAAAAVQEHAAGLDPEAVKEFNKAADPAGTQQMAVNAARQMQHQLDLEIERLSPEQTEEQAGQRLVGVDLHARAKDPSAPRPCAAVVIIPAEAVTPDDQGGYRPYTFLAHERLPVEVQQRLTRIVDQAIIDARLSTDPRAKAGGLSPETIRAIMADPRTTSKTITLSGEEKSGAAAAMRMLVPAAFMVLMLIAVMTGGQSLLTSTIEEKSSRVMEVLLSAVSPMQLMVGKILGQMGVASLIMLVYGGLGVGSLLIFSLQHLVEPFHFVYLIFFFLIAFFTMASLLAAIGSAVNELREAQTLQTPVILLVMLPWLLWLPISRAPNSLFATLLSFVPGLNPFVMIIRIPGAEPVPFWQIPLSMLVGLVTVAFCCWASAKVFRVGVLMYGKPPDFKTLVRWVRMA